MSLLHSCPVSVGVLPDGGGVTIVVMAPDGCYGGNEEGSGGGPVFASVSTVCALLPSPSLLRYDLFRILSTPFYCCSIIANDYSISSSDTSQSKVFYIVYTFSTTISSCFQEYP